MGPPLSLHPLYYPRHTPQGCCDSSSLAPECLGCGHVRHPPCPASLTASSAKLGLVRAPELSEMHTYKPTDLGRASRVLQPVSSAIVTLLTRAHAHSSGAITAARSIHPLVPTDKAIHAGEPRHSIVKAQISVLTTPSCLAPHWHAVSE
jgi:hypothetical protein